MSTAKEIIDERERQRVAIRLEEAGKIHEDSEGRFLFFTWVVKGRHTWDILESVETGTYKDGCWEVARLKKCIICGLEWKGFELRKIPSSSGLSNW